MTKFFRVDPEFMSTKRVRVRVCNVPAFLIDEILASFLSAYGRVDDVSKQRSAAGTSHGNNVFRICLTKEGFPDTILSRERQIVVVVECRQSRCWNWKQIGHLSKAFPQKNIQTTNTTNEKPLKEAEIKIKLIPGTWRLTEFQIWMDASRTKKVKKGTPPKNQRSYPKLRRPKLWLSKNPANRKNQHPQPPMTLYIPGKSTDRRHQQRTPPSKHIWKHPTIWQKEETLEKNTLKKTLPKYISQTRPPKEKNAFNL